MRKETFALKLVIKMEDRIWEILDKYYSKNFNGASVPAFFIGLQGDIVTFLKENKLEIIKK